MNAILQLPPFTPGFHSRVPYEEYARMEGMNMSRLKELGRSAQHYQHRLHHPKESKALRLGKAAHCAVLEPTRFGSEFAVWERRTSNGNMAPRNGQYWDKFQADHAGLEIISADEYATAIAMQQSVRSNPDAMRYLAEGDAEFTMQWEAFGHRCKGRGDWRTRDPREGFRPTIAGLKSARDCRPFQFGRQAAQLGYHLAWAFYFDGFKTLTGEMPKMVEIVVESDAPHAVVVYVIPDEVIQLGCEEYIELLSKLDEFEHANAWPGPAPGEQILTLPAYVYGKEEITYVDE